jgi:hypothetical protein
MTTAKSIKARGGNGRALRTVAMIEQDKKAAELRSRSWTYQRIADEFGIDVSNAYRSVMRGLSEEMTPTEDQIEAKKLELAKLDRIESYLLGVMEREHIRVDHGKVIEIDGAAMLDDGPGVQAALGLLRVMARRTKYRGFDEPSKQRMEYVAHDSFMEEMQRLEAEVKALEAKSSGSDRSDTGGEAALRGTASET